MIPVHRFPSEKQLVGDYWIRCLRAVGSCRIGKLFQLNVQTQFAAPVSSVILQLVAANAETIFRVTQLASPRRFSVHLTSEGNPSTQRSVHRHRVSVIGLGVTSGSGRKACRSRSAFSTTSRQISRDVKHRVGDVMKNVETENSSETGEGPVRVEQGWRIEFDVDFLAATFQEAERMRRSQVGHHLLLETSPRTRTEETLVVTERAGRLVGVFARQQNRNWTSQSSVLARVLEQLCYPLHGKVSHFRQLVTTRGALV